MKDGVSSEREKQFFDKVQPYTVSAETAVLFSPTWAEQKNKK